MAFPSRALTGFGRAGRSSSGDTSQTLIQAGTPADISAENLLEQIAALQDSPFGIDQDVLDLEAAGLKTLEGATNVDEQLAAAQDKFSSTILPGLQARLSAAGFGRGGAIGEVGERAGRGLLDPILARQAQSQNIFGQAQLGLGQLRGQRRIGQQTSIRNLALALQNLQANERARLDSLRLGLQPRGGGGGGRSGGRGLFPPLVNPGVPFSGQGGSSVVSGSPGAAPLSPERLAQIDLILGSGGLSGGGGGSPSQPAPIFIPGIGSEEPLAGSPFLSQ